MQTLRFPDPDTTTRPDVPIADAYLVDGVESEVVDGNYFTLPFASDVESDENVTPLRLLCSVDHGLRPADETSAIIGLNAAAEVYGTLVDWFGGNSRSLNWWGAMCDVLGVDGWTGGWLPDEHADVDIHEWSRDMESAAWSAGLVADTNSDSGMSWVYAPLSAPIPYPSADDTLADENDYVCTPVGWVHDSSRDGAGCSWCGSFAQVDADNLCRDCFAD